MKIVHLICAARPNFMKVAPLYHALKNTTWCEPVLVWGEQHQDNSMSWGFLNEFGLANVGALTFPIGAGTHAQQTGNAMVGYEVVCKERWPDAAVVVGDVNATMACALVAAKLGIPVVHLEAGLRSFDRSMPEEINRVVTDAVSNLHLAPSQGACENLIDEGADSGRIENVGNIMIDAFEMLRPQIEAVPKREGPYAVVTLHRPSNVDNKDKLIELLDEIREVAFELPVVFPMHPRTYKRVLESGELPWLDINNRIEYFNPRPYVEFMALVKNATIVITDSGGVQEETSYLGVPCATVRENTERPVTLTHGTNVLIKPDGIVGAAQLALRAEWRKGRPIPLWDGKTAGRCVAALQRFLC